MSRQTEGGKTGCKKKVKSKTCLQMEIAPSWFIKATKAQLNMMIT